MPVPTPGAVRSRQIEPGPVVEHDTPLQSQSTAGLAASKGKPTVSLSREAVALALLVQDPELTDAEIARRAGCARTTLYRWPLFKKAKAVLFEAGKSQRTRGVRIPDRSGRMVTDGVDDRDPSEGVED